MQVHLLYDSFSSTFTHQARRVDVRSAYCRGRRTCVQTFRRSFVSILITVFLPRIFMPGEAQTTLVLVGIISSLPAHGVGSDGTRDSLTTLSTATHNTAVARALLFSVKNGHLSPRHSTRLRPYKRASSLSVNVCTVSR